MDLYRYFHPHHNPRLLATPVRLQEFAELEQAAIELKRALERAELRTAQHPVGGINAGHVNGLIVAMNYVVESLSTLTHAHPGDSQETMREILREREDAPGWENWSRLLRQRLELETQYERPAAPAKNLSGELLKSESVEPGLPEDPMAGAASPHPTR